MSTPQNTLQHKAGRDAAIVAFSVGMMLAWAQVASADVRLPALIGDNMVLQQGSEVPIWGWADPGEQVTVTLDDRTWETTTSDAGEWLVRVRPPAVGGPYKLSISGKNEVRLRNVMVGEVWIASGQSNMEFGLELATNGAEEVASATYPEIRLFKVARAFADRPQPDCSGSWEPCAPKSAYGFSAVGYAFGRALHRELNVPVGIVHTAWGGTWAEAWIGRDALEADAHYEAILQRYAQREICEFFTSDSLSYPAAVEAYRVAYSAWLEGVTEASRGGTVLPPAPRKPYDPQLRNAPSSLYNAMIAPLVPYGIRGVIWNQGEWNARRAYRYREVFPALIRNWRAAWHQGNFPFYFVQLGLYGGYEVPESAAELREAQLMTLSLPNTGMAVTMDIGDPNNVHPPNKQDVGERLALWALARDYGRDGLVYSGPLYRSATVEDGRIRLEFDHVGGGLVAMGDLLTHFTIADEDTHFVEADAVIDGDSIVVSAESVAAPVAVRYAWSNASEPNLFNREGLPASPFRTDDWQTVTAGEK